MLKIFNIEIFRFIIVGIINTGFSYCVYAGAIFIGLPYYLASFVSIVLGILFSFKTQGAFVFKNTNNALFGRFILCWGILYVFAVFIIWLFLHFGFNEYWAGMLALPFTTILSYLAQKYYVFKAEIVDKTQREVFY